MRDWFNGVPRYIDGELVENQWKWLGGWLVYEPDPDCPYCELIYSNWRMMWGRYENKPFGQILFKYWPTRKHWTIRWGV